MVEIKSKREQIIQSIRTFLDEWDEGNKYYRIELAEIDLSQGFPNRVVAVLSYYVNLPPSHPMAKVFKTDKATNTIQSEFILDPNLQVTRMKKLQYV